MSYFSLSYEILSKILASRIQLEDSWLELMGDVFAQKFMKDLREFLVNAKKDKKLVYPSSKEIFRAMNLITVQDTRVVIIGQDPYHGPGQANFMCVSAPWHKVYKSTWHRPSYVAYSVVPLPHIRELYMAEGALCIL